MIQVVEWHIEVIFCFLTKPKMQLFSSRLSEWHLKVIICILTCPTFDFGDVEEAMFQVVARYWEHIFFLLTSPKCELDEVEKAMFQCLACHFELIFDFVLPKI